MFPKGVSELFYPRELNSFEGCPDAFSSNTKLHFEVSQFSLWKIFTTFSYHLSSQLRNFNVITLFFTFRQALEAKAALYEKMAKGEIQGTL